MDTGIGISQWLLGCCDCRDWVWSLQGSLHASVSFSDAEKNKIFGKLNLNLHNCSSGCPKPTSAFLTTFCKYCILCESQVLTETPFNLLCYAWFAFRFFCTLFVSFECIRVVSVHPREVYWKLHPGACDLEKKAKCFFFFFTKLRSESVLLNRKAHHFLSIFIFLLFKMKFSYGWIDWIYSWWKCLSPALQVQRWIYIVA